jgi:hypothetical protein
MITPRLGRGFSIVVYSSIALSPSLFPKQAIGRRPMNSWIPTGLPCFVRIELLMELARMIALILLALNLLAALVKSKVDLKPEMPGSGSGCLCCSGVRGRVRFSNRLFCVQLYLLVPVDPQGNAGYPARDVDTVAPCRVSRLLAQEVFLSGRQAARSCGRWSGE